MIVDDIREYVKQAAAQPASVLGTDFYEQHIVVMAAFADTLACALGADREIVALSACLHDISAVTDFSVPSRHVEMGVVKAAEILKEYAYSEDKIPQIQQCILTHSNPVAPGEGTIEEVCISNADAMAQITNPRYWLYFGFTVRKLSYTECVNWYLEKIDTHFSKLTQTAKELIAGKYNAVRSMLVDNPHEAV